MTEPGFKVKEVTDRGNHKDEDGILQRTIKVRLSTFGNRRMCLENASRRASCHLIERDKALTWLAGLSSGTGKVSSHLFMSTHVKWILRKRCRRDDGSHDFDTSAHDWRDQGSESAARRSRISSTISCGILGMMIILTFMGVGCVAFEVFELVRGGWDDVSRTLVFAWRPSVASYAMETQSLVLERLLNSCIYHTTKG